MKDIMHFIEQQAFPLLVTALVIGFLISAWYAISHANDDLDKWS